MEQNGKHLTAFADGAAEPTNPGPMSAGYVIQDTDGKQLEAKGFYLGGGTNNEAEYHGVIKAIEAAVWLGATHLDLRTDSQLVVKQVHGLWVVNAEHLRALRERVVELLAQVPHWTLEWIPRERNWQADVCAVNAAKFKKDLDYSDREILEPSDHAGRVRVAMGDYMKHYRRVERPRWTYRNNRRRATAK